VRQKKWSVMTERNLMNTVQYYTWKYNTRLLATLRLYTPVRKKIEPMNACTAMTLSATHKYSMKYTILSACLPAHKRHLVALALPYLAADTFHH